MRGLSVAVYGWTYAVYFGLVALDSVYARQLTAAVEPAIAQGIFSKISDVLILPLGLLVLAGVAACAGAGTHTRALIPIIGSGLLLIALPALRPLLVAVLDGTGYGATLRVLTIALGSVLAMLGVVRFRRSDFEP